MLFVHRSALALAAGTMSFVIMLAAVVVSSGASVAMADDGNATTAPVELLTRAERAAVGGLPEVPTGLNAAWKLERRPSKRVRATFTYTVTAPNLVAREWLLFLSRPEHHPAHDVTVTAPTPDAEEIRDLSARRQPLWRWRTPVGDGDAEPDTMKWSVSLDVQLFSRKLARGRSRSKGRALGADERRLSLRPTGGFDYRDRVVIEFARQHKLERETREGEVEFARRVFQAIARNFEYHYVGEQDRSAAGVIGAGRSDCGGLSTLFATVLRSQGIPARTIAGRWATSARPGQRIGGVAYFQEHVKAEFWADGLGWVPADLSSAVLHDPSKEKVKYFAADPGDFIVFHFDTNLRFDTVDFGERTFALLQKPSHWATGRGDFVGVTTAETWTVK